MEGRATPVASRWVDENVWHGDVAGWDDDVCTMRTMATARCAAFTFRAPATFCWHLRVKVYEAVMEFARRIRHCTQENYLIRCHARIPYKTQLLYSDISSLVLETSLHDGVQCSRMRCYGPGNPSTVGTLGPYRTGTSFFSAAFFAKGINSGAPGRYCTCQHRGEQELAFSVLPSAAARGC